MLPPASCLRLGVLHCQLTLVLLGAADALAGFIAMISCIFSDRWSMVSLWPVCTGLLILFFPNSMLSSLGSSELIYAPLRSMIPPCVWRKSTLWMMLLDLLSTATQAMGNLTSSARRERIVWSLIRILGLKPDSCSSGMSTLPSASGSVSTKACSSVLPTSISSAGHAPRVLWLVRRPRWILRLATSLWCERQWSAPRGWIGRLGPILPSLFRCPLCAVNQRGPLGVSWRRHVGSPPRRCRSTSPPVRARWT